MCSTAVAIQFFNNLEISWMTKKFSIYSKSSSMPCKACFNLDTCRVTARFPNQRESFGVRFKFLNLLGTFPKINKFLHHFRKFFNDQHFFFFFLPFLMTGVFQWSLRIPKKRNIYQWFGKFPNEIKGFPMTGNNFQLQKNLRRRVYFPIPSYWESFPLLGKASRLLENLTY